MYFKAKRLPTDRPVSDKAYFAVPHRPRPMRAKKLGDHVCPFLKEEGRACTVRELFNGRDDEASLSMFYMKAPKAKGEDDPNLGADYIFISPDEEEEFAELIGVKLYEGEGEGEGKGKDKSEDNTEKETPTDSLSKEQLSLHKENIADIRKGLKAIGVEVHIVHT